MARTIKDPKLDTRSARLKLGQRREPYWRPLSEGLAIGYRKGAKGGTWIARHYSAAHGRRYHSIGTADDILDADNVHVLSFNQAQSRARDWAGDIAKQDGGAKVHIGPYTVGDALTAYLNLLEGEGRSIRDTRCQVSAHIRPTLGDADIGDLTPERLRHWRDDLVKKAPKVRRAMSDEDAKRARRASANRTWNVLRAALNHAFNEGNTKSDLAWRKVKPFRGVDAARVRYLTITECKRLINACDTEFRPLVQAALQTGARYSELCNLVCSDFNPDVGTIAIRKSKSGKARHIVLTDEGTDFFQQLVAGRAGDDPMFGRKWARDLQTRPMARAVERSKITPAASFHTLRHTWASHAVMNGVPLMIVARNLGHADTRMVEKHYGHLAPSYIADEIRRGAPRFGSRSDKKVVAIRPV